MLSYITNKIYSSISSFILHPSIRVSAAYVTVYNMTENSCFFVFDSLSLSLSLSFFLFVFFLTLFSILSLIRPVFIHHRHLPLQYLLCLHYHFPHYYPLDYWIYYRRYGPSCPQRRSRSQRRMNHHSNRTHHSHLGP